MLVQLGVTNGKSSPIGEELFPFEVACETSSLPLFYLDCWKVEEQEPHL